MGNQKEQMVKEKGLTILGLLLCSFLGMLLLTAALGFLYSLLNFLKEIFLTSSLKDYILTVSFALLGLVGLFATIINELTGGWFVKFIKGNG